MEAEEHKMWPGVEVTSAALIAYEMSPSTRSYADAAQEGAELEFAEMPVQGPRLMGAGLPYPRYMVWFTPEGPAELGRRLRMGGVAGGGRGERGMKEETEASVLQSVLLHVPEQ